MHEDLVDESYHRTSCDLHLTELVNKNVIKETSLLHCRQ